MLLTLSKNIYIGETKRLQALPQFARAPVMRKLLVFLVEQTLSGRGDTLKAYQIAVDALGRSESFDPQSDSYPRVQVGRLRKMLDEAYRLDAQGAEPTYPRLMIQKGSYKVHLLTASDNPQNSADNANSHGNKRRNTGANAGQKTSTDTGDTAGHDDALVRLLAVGAAVVLAINILDRWIAKRAP